MELLRFLTCGSVDDGKSTLIGRLLYDTQAIQADQLEALERSREHSGEERVNLALLTDGLRAEREQGITIDVAYKYFSTPRRKFIIADTPGHVQYTRNMVTGASTAHLALLLLDARSGIVEQTRRHAYIAALLGIRHLVLCVNKMDLVDYSESEFQTIRQQFAAVSEALGLPDVLAIPIVAVDGENIASRSSRMPWYQGPALLEHLETVELQDEESLKAARLPVQYVLRPQSAEYRDYRAFAGRIAGGAFRPGDAVVVLPAGIASTVESVDFSGSELAEARAPQSIALRLADDIDAGRGAMIAEAARPPVVSQEFQARICWMSEQRLVPGSRFLLQHTTRRVRAVVRSIDSTVDLHALRDGPGSEELRLNDLGAVTIRCSEPLCFDAYAENRRTGSFILIDERSNNTEAAGMIVEGL
ncbi:MAG: sulfate adenylyltransferase [Leptospirales bacterium]|nr:sulfate adenylyltransferase [Leptospirales bacterium]